MTRVARRLTLVAAALLFLTGLGSIDLWAPDEPRYAQVAEEIRSFRHGAAGLVLLHLADAPYTQKPPLYFWLAAASGALDGRVTARAARLPAALAGVAVVALTLLLGAGLAPRTRVGLLGAWILLSLPRFVHQARRAQLDVLLTACFTAALTAFWRIDAREQAGSEVPRGWVVLLHGAVALGVLTKGPVGLLPYAVIVAYLAWERRLADARISLPAWGVALGCVPALAWIAGAVALAPAGFFGAAVIDNVFARFFTGTDHVRPFYYFAYQFPLDFLPWTPALLLGCVAGLRSAREPSSAPGERRAARFLLAWVGVLFVFFSFSSGKRGLYLLPAYPAAALLCGLALDRLLARGASLRGALCGPLAAFGAGALGALGLWLQPGLVAAFGVAPGPPGAWAAGILALCAGAAIATATLLRRRPLRAVGAAIGGVIALEVAILCGVFPALDDTKSPRPLAEAAARVTRPSDRIGVYRSGALIGGLHYYAGRTVVALESPDAVRRFAQDGGRAIVVKPRDRAAVSRVTPTRVRATERTGERQLWLLDLDSPSH